MICLLEYTTSKGLCKQACVHGEDKSSVDMTRLLAGAPGIKVRTVVKIPFCSKATVPGQPFKGWSIH